MCLWLSCRIQCMMCRIGWDGRVIQVKIGETKRTALTHHQVWDEKSLKRVKGNVRTRDEGEKGWRQKKKTAWRLTVGEGGSYLKVCYKLKSERKMTKQQTGVSFPRLRNVVVDKKTKTKQQSLIK